MTHWAFRSSWLLILGAALAVGSRSAAALPAAVELELSQRQLLSYLITQDTAPASIRLSPEAADWQFLANHLPELVTPAGEAYPWPGDPDQAPVVIVDGDSADAGTLCARFGDYRVLLRGQMCPGEWVATRADPAASGASTYRLGWSAPGEVVGETDLQWRQSLDYQRVLEVGDAVLGRVLYTQYGAGVAAFDASGSLLWSTQGLGLGELIDVADLDGDDSPELIYSPAAQLAAGLGGSGPGALVVLDARSGAVLWRYAFSGLESGITRERTAVASFDGGQTRSIVAVLTYSNHAWRFDFSEGVRNGRLAWKSTPLVYNGPYKRPLVSDLDGDGSVEVVVDTYGRSYVLDGDTGTAKTSTAYASNYTFGGSMELIETADGPGVAVVSTSIYFDGAAYLKYSNGTLVPAWSQVFEENLGNQQVTFRPAPNSIEVGGTRMLVWSVGSGSQTLHLVELETGASLATRPGSTFAQLLRGADGKDYVVAHEAAGAAVLECTQAGFVVAAQFPGMQAAALPTVGRPSRALTTDETPQLALMLDPTGAPTALRVAADGSVQSWNPNPGFVMREPGTAHLAADHDALLFSDGQMIYRALGGQSAFLAGLHSATSYAVPLVADLLGTGHRSTLVRYGPRLAKADPLPGQSPLFVPLGKPIIGGSREALYSPLVAGAAGTPRSIVSYEREVQPALVARDPTGNLLWQNSTLFSGWENSIAAGFDENGGAVLYQHHSLSTRRLDPATGATLWNIAGAGQCQRQMAVHDFDGDGVPDLGLQTAESLGIYDSVSGAFQQSHFATGSYGGYTSVAFEDLGGGRAPVLLAHNSGGFTSLAAAGQVSIDAQIDTRLFESIPLVVQRAESGDERIWQISGEGRLRRVTATGNVLATRNIDEPVLAMSGAYIDGDSHLDLLVTTFRGTLIALSGATTAELWRIDLGVPASAAVATDYDGDGVGEILLTTVDGRLLVVRERATLAYALDAAGKLSTLHIQSGTWLPLATISGLAPGDIPVALDIRPRDAGLYLLTRDAAFAGRLYALDPDTAAATLLATLIPAAGDASSPYVQLPPSALSIDVDPVADVLRVIGTEGTSLQVDFVTGAVVTDEVVGPAAIDAVAHDRNKDGEAATQLFGLDADDDILARVDPATGTLQAVGALGFDVHAVLGFDVLSVGSNDTGYAGLDDGGATPGLYSIALQTGATQRLADLPAGIIALAVRPLRESQIASLSALSPSLGTLSPQFASGIMTYSLVVPGQTPSIAFAPMAEHSGASILVQGEAVASGAMSSPITLAVGSTVVEVLVTAEDGVTTGSYVVVVTRDPGISIVGPALADGEVGAYYSHQFIADGAGSVLPYRYAIIDGTLPGGLTLAQDGTLSGIPTSAGTYAFTVRAIDSSPGSTGGPFAAMHDAVLTIAKKPQSIAFAVLPDVVFGEPVALAPMASATSGLTVAFVSTTPAVCAVAGSAVQMLAAGSCGIEASQSGDALHLPAAPQQRSFAIARRLPSILLDGALEAAQVGVPVLFTATIGGSSPGGTVAFTDNDVAVPGCAAVSLSGLGDIRTATCVVTPASTGAHMVRATYSGDAGHHPRSETRALPVGNVADIRLSLQRVSPAEGALFESLPQQVEYRLALENVGTEDLQALIRFEPIFGLQAVTWQCVMPTGCAPSAGSADTPLAISLAQGETREVALVGTVDYTRPYVEISIYASAAASTVLINISDDAATLTEPTDDLGVFRSGYE